MKRFLFTALLLLLSGITILAQNLTWEKYFYTEAGALFSIKTDFEGNFLTTGKCDTITSWPPEKSVTMKLDSYGTIIWKSLIDEGGRSITHAITLADNIGGAVVTGYSI